MDGLPVMLMFMVGAFEQTSADCLEGVGFISSLCQRIRLCLQLVLNIGFIDL
jgi:hypothetical protein